MRTWCRCAFSILLVAQQLLLVAPARSAINLAAGKPLDQRPSTTQMNPAAQTSVVDPDLFTGQASYRYPIALPPGTGGLTPRLALAYGSHGSNSDGPVGAGWSIDVGYPTTIQRSTRNGAPSYTSADTFTYGGSDLVETATPRSFVLENFEPLKIEWLDTTSLGGFWRVLRPDGTRLYYGRDYSPNGNPANDSRVRTTILNSTYGTSASCSPPFTTCLPEPILNPGLPFAWQLDRIEDRNGNVVRLMWDSKGDFATRYLAAISYSEHLADSGGVPAFGGTLGNPIDTDRWVEFIYTNLRPNSFATYRAGIPARLRNRLSTVNIRVAGQLSRVYRFDYRESTVSGRSLLWRAKERGSLDEAAGEFVHEFTYSDGGSTGWAAEVPWTLPPGADTAFVDASGLDNGVRLLDVNGDSWLDFVQAKSGLRRTFLGRPGTTLGGPGAFESTASDTWIPPSDFVAPRYTGTVLADLDGNGLPDFSRRRLVIRGDLTQPGAACGTGTSWHHETFGSWDSGAWLNSGSGWTPDSGPMNPGAIALSPATTAGAAASCPFEYSPTAIELQGISVGFDQASRYVDVNGDGRDDIVSKRALVGYANAVNAETQEHRMGVRLNSPVGFLTANSNQYYQADVFNATTGALGASFLQIFSGKTWQLPVATPAESVRWSWVKTCLGVPNRTIEGYSGVERIIDLNGDGLPEIVTAANSCPVDPDNPTHTCPEDIDWEASTHVAVNNGYGWASPSVSHGEGLWQAPESAFVVVSESIYSVLSCTETPAGWAQDTGTRFIDLNGDGGADVLSDGAADSVNGGTFDSARWNANTPQIWVEDSNWNAPEAFTAGSLGADPNVRLADVNADGMVDLVKATTVRLNRATAPDKLVRVQTPHGAVTSITYRPHTAVDTVQSITQPLSLEAGQRRQSAPIWVVDTVSVDPGAGSGQPEFGRSFDFFDGIYDIDDRAFRGFKRVHTIGDVVDGRQRSEWTYFHTSDGLKGRIAQRDVGDLGTSGGADRLIDRWFFHWSVAHAAETPVHLFIGTNPAADFASSHAQVAAYTAHRAIVGSVASASQAYLAFPVAIQRNRFEGATATQQTVRTDRVFDIHGNATWTNERGDLATSVDDITTVRTFAAAPSNVYLANRPSVETVSGQQGQLPVGTTLSRTVRTIYDSQLIGQVHRGNPTLTRLDWTRNGTMTALATSRTFDSYGNVLTIAAPKDESPPLPVSQLVREVEYDAATKTFPITVEEYSAQNASSLYSTSITYTGCGAPGGYGLVCTVTDTTGQVSASTYDQFGRLTVSTEPNGAATAYLYHDIDRATSNQRVEARVRWDTNGPAGAAVATDPNAHIEIAYLDGLLRPITQTRSGTGSNVGRRYLDYDAEGRLASVSRWDFAAAPVGLASLTYDSLGRVVRETLSDGSKIETVHGAPFTLTTVREQAVAGGVIVAKRGVVEDGHGRTAEVHEYVDPNGSAAEVTSLAWDPFGQLGLIRDAAANNPLVCAGSAVCLGQRHETRFFYDETGNRTRLDDPNTGTWTWTYDAAALLGRETAPDGIELEYSYDGFGRLERVHPVNPVRPEADRVFEYGSPSDSDLLARGRLKRIDDSEGFDAYAYDEAGNIAGHERVVAGRSFVFGRSYDPLGRVIGTTYPDGEFVSWHHDKRLLTRIDSARIAPDAYLADASYDAQARVTNVRLGRNAQNPVIQQTWVYDNVTDGLDRTFAIRTQDSSQIANLDYTVDGIGRVRGTVFTTRRVSDEVQLTNSFSYQLDGLGRISQVVGQLGAGPSIHDFVYDGLGNLTRMADNGVSGSELQYQDPMRPNAVTRAAPIGSGTTRDFTYDPAGRVSSQIYSGTISGVTRPLEYDSQGRPTRAGDFYFGYDAFGERVRTYALPGGGDGKIVHPERDYSFEGDKGTKHFFLDGRRIASAAVSFIPPSAESPFAATVGRPPTVTAPLDAKSVAAIWLIAAAILCAAGLARASRRPISSRLTAMTLVAALGPFLMGSRARVPFGTHSEDRIFYVTDHLGGTILAVTNTGTLRNRFLYHPFGQRRSAEGPALEKQWIGGSFLMAPFVEYQAIYSFGPRLYDPNVGRFLQPDPLIGSPEAPQSLNAYGYALNSPFDAKDPSGYGPECEDTVGGCGPVGGSGLGTYNEAACIFFGCGPIPIVQEPVYKASNVPQAYPGSLQREQQPGGYEIYDPPIEPAIGPVEIISGLYGAGRIIDGVRYGLPALARLLANRGGREAADEVAEQAARYGDETLAKIERQLKEHGRRSLERSQRSLQKRLGEHREALDQYRRAGGHTSSVEREIRAFESELRAIEDVLGGLE